MIEFYLEEPFIRMEIFFLQSNGVIIAAVIGAAICLGLLLYKEVVKRTGLKRLFYFFVLSILSL